VAGLIFMALRSITPDFILTIHGIMILGMSAIMVPGLIGMPSTVARFSPGVRTLTGRIMAIVVTTGGVIMAHTTEDPTAASTP
jgi:hypothetical protein